MQQTPETDSFTEKPGSLTNYILGFAILGMLLAVLFAWWINSEYAQNWEFIVQALPGTVQFLGGNSSDIYIESKDGQIYSCARPAEADCWIPDYFPPDMEAAIVCDLSRPAFRASKIPPDEIRACWQITYAIPDGIETRYYVLKQNGEIWGWSQGSSAYGWLLYAAALVIGGLLGAFLGSLIWLLLAYFNRVRRIQPWISVRQVLLLTIIGVLAIFGLFVFLLPLLKDNSAKHLINVSSQVTQIDYPTQSPRSAAVDLIELACAARWKAGSNDAECPDQKVSEKAPYFVSPGEQTIETNPLRATALVMPISSKSQFAEGMYSSLEILPGDHFRATIGCLDTSEACEAVFEVGYLLPSGNKVVLGRWEQINDGQTTDIDLNLEKLAGLEVRLRLYVFTHSEGGKQLPAWVNPVIGP